MHHSFSRGIFSAALLLCATPALAADPTLELLAQKGLITADEYASLKEKQKDQASNLNINLKDGLKISTADGKSAVQLGTLMQMDFAHVEQRNRDAASGSEFRRARLYLNGATGVWTYRFEAEFTGTPTFTDAWAAWSGPVTVTGGHFKQPYSLEALMSDKDLAFMERSLSSSLLAVRAPGFMLSQGGTAWSWAAGVFGEALTTTTTDDEGGGLSARGSWAPLLGDGHTLHLGASLHWREASQGTATSYQQFASKPEINLFPTTSRQLNTGTIANVDAFWLLGLEAAQAFGPVLAQAEYSWAKVDRKLGDDLDFGGGYAQLSWALTGEVRPYQGNRGLFGGIRPKGEVAWEVALRLSRLDLSDGTIKGGEESNASASLNSYLGNNVKLSLNYVQALDVAADSPNAAQGKARALMMRAQFAY